MTKIMRLVLLFLSISIFHSNINAQNTTNNRMFEAVKEYSKKNQNNKSLSMQLLKSASKIIYGFNNGSVHPDFHYQGYIIVTPNNVTMEIYNKSQLCYSNSQILTSKQYSTFLNDLFSLGVKQNPDEPILLCGDGVYNLIIQKNGTAVFQGIEDEDIVTTKGRLCDAFKPLLTTEMRDVYNDPSKTFDPTNEIDLDNYLY